MTEIFKEAEREYEVDRVAFPFNSNESAIAFMADKDRLGWLCMSWRRHGCHVDATYVRPLHPEGDGRQGSD